MYYYYYYKLDSECMSSKILDFTFEYLYYCIGTQSNQVSVTSLIGGSSDNTGSGIAHRLGKSSENKIELIYL